MYLGIYIFNLIQEIIYIIEIERGREGDRESLIMIALPQDHSICGLVLVFVSLLYSKSRTMLGGIRNQEVRQHCRCLKMHNSSFVISAVSPLPPPHSLALQQVFAFITWITLSLMVRLGNPHPSIQIWVRGHLVPQTELCTSSKTTLLGASLQGNCNEWFVFVCFHTRPIEVLEGRHLCFYRTYAALPMLNQ